uniref:Caspase n=1 Tax=Pithovirus LCPAC001 TaxID=2506585 RepID=A0A481Z299_9VIRU|nr:MAG: caspase [Pithovirus LCPAC001]
MTSVLIIGIDYFNTPSESTLPGITDMRYMYDYIRKIKPDKILVITDADENDNVVKGIIDPNDIYFINNIQSYNEYHFYQGKTDMINVIKNFVSTNNRLVVYYSGHGSNNNILLPNYSENVSFIPDLINVSKFTPHASRSETRRASLAYSGVGKFDKKKITDNTPEINQTKNKISFEEFKNIITKYSPKKTQIIFLMDCCAGNGLKLPFKMNINGIYNLKNYNIPTQEIVCISSSLQNQSSISSINVDGFGSVFTKEFFEGISRMRSIKTVSYINLIKKIGSEKLNNYDQTLNVYSSRPNLKKVWHWFFEQSKSKIECKNGYISLTYN